MLTASKAEHCLFLADAIIAAFAIRKHAVLMHKDPEFDALAGLVMTVTPSRIFSGKCPWFPVTKTAR